MVNRLRFQLLYIAEIIGVDRAVTYATMIRVWALVAGPVSLLIIASKFSSELQGYYYTFNSLLALTAFLDLGLATVVQIYASHEWAHLELISGEPRGDQKAIIRLAGLAKLALKWYSSAGLLAILGLSIFGIVFFSRTPSGDIQWLFPWLALSALSGLNLMFLPAWSVLEGCNQMSHTLQAKLFISIIVSLTTWSCIVTGTNLWTASIVILVNILLSVSYLILAYGKFFRRLLIDKSVQVVNWKKELWPVQWKIALAWISNYFMYSAFTPIVFHFEGSVEAGQMGLSWTAVHSILLISLSWVATRAPLFGMLTARKEYHTLDKLFRLVVMQIMIIGILAGGALWLLITLLNIFEFPLAERFIAPDVLFILVLANIPCMITAAMTVYLRANKDEPLVYIHVTAGAMTILVSILSVSNFGIRGMALGFLLVSIFFYLLPTFIIFRRLQRFWHLTPFTSLPDG